MVATDGHRLSYAQRKTAAQGDGAGARARPAQGHPRDRAPPGDGDSATFQQVENHLVFVVGGRTLASKMIEGQFPAFEKVIAFTGDKMVALGASCWPPPSAA